jgi:hypothetical protein
MSGTFALAQTTQNTGGVFSSSGAVLNPSAPSNSADVGKSPTVNFGNSQELSNSQGFNNSQDLNNLSNPQDLPKMGTGTSTPNLQRK